MRTGYMIHKKYASYSHDLKRGVYKDELKNNPHLLQRKPTGGSFADLFTEQYQRPLRTWRNGRREGLKIP